MEKKGLGKGLDALFLDEREENSVSELEIELIEADPHQHRKTFHDETIEELAESIKAHGIIQPLIVRPDGAKYKIVAGERRYRASKIAGLEKVPVIIRDDMTDRDAAEIALIENLQREDLNPVDEALGYEKLISDFGITQEEAGKRVGKSRVAITNSLRLLSLPREILEKLRDGDISAGHARALLPLKDSDEAIEMLSRIITEGLSVRDTENEVRWIINNVGEEPEERLPFPTGHTEPTMFTMYIKKVEKTLMERLGRRVKIKAVEGKTSGKLVLSYISTEDLEQMIEKLCGEDILDRLDN